MSRKGNDEDYINERCKQFKTSKDYLDHFEEYKRMKDEWKKPNFFFRTQERSEIPYGTARKSKSPGNIGDKSGSRSGNLVNTSTSAGNDVNNFNNADNSNNAQNAGDNSTQVNISASTVGSSGSATAGAGNVEAGEKGAGIYTFLQLEQQQQLQLRQQQRMNKKPIKELERSFVNKTFCKSEFYPNVKSIDEIDWFEHHKTEAAVPRIAEIPDNKVPGPGHYTSKFISCGMHF